MKYNLYDFDGTIYDGDSMLDLIIYFSIRKPIIIVKLIYASVRYLFSGSKEQFKTTIFNFIKDIDIDKYIDDFWDKHIHKIKFFWLEKDDHSKDIIISASCDFWLDYIAKKYKIKKLICTRFDKKEGKIIGTNCHGKEKVRRFYEEFPNDKIKIMYTDSNADLPVIEEAEEGIFVKKNKLIKYK